MGVLPIAPIEEEPAALRAALVNDIMPALLRLHGGVAVRLVERLPPNQAVSTARHVRQGDRSLNWALLVEASEDSTLKTAASHLDATTLESLGARIEMEMAMFRTIYRVSPQ